jgi:hypothetical protein
MGLPGLAFQKDVAGWCEDDVVDGGTGALF